VRFQIVGPIENVRTIAVGVVFTGSHISGRSMAKVVGGSSKVTRRSSSRTARFAVRKSTGTKRTELGGGTSRSNDSSTSPEFVVCIDPAGNDDLQARRLYQVLPDASAARSDFVRVIDDSGEDYLYPASCFAEANLASAVKDALRVHP
jgi:hypothetical protein